MRSKAHFKTHPIHPILVGFPIAFFSGAFFTDLLFAINHKEIFYRFAGYLEMAGVVFAVLAAIPGIIDYYYTVPPKSSAKKRGTKHAMLNVSMLLLFSTALFLRWNYDTNIYYILSLELIGMICLSVAGWMGGTLVNRNQIGVDHRYAYAGKWDVVTITTKQKEVELHGLEKMQTNQMKLLIINGKRIVLGKTETEFLAFDDFCSHRGASLADGSLICRTVQCPWHGSQFDIKTGALKAGPATGPIKTFPVELRGDKFFLIHSGVD